MSFCHLVPPQDTKWHKVPLSGEDTKWHNVCHLVSFVMFVTIATEICIKAFSYANKEGSKRYIGFWKIIYDNCGFHGNKIIE